jgi:hypothetical protein
MTVHRSLSFKARQPIDPAQAGDLANGSAAAEGTYRSNWGLLKGAAYWTTRCCMTNMEKLLLPAADRIREAKLRPEERALLLSLEHSRLVGGPALCAIAGVAFAQESFVGLAYLVALEVRLQISRSGRSQGTDRTVAQNLALFDREPFEKRCRSLLAELRAPFGDAFRQAVDLMTFRNSVAHDSPLLSIAAGGEQAGEHGSPRGRRAAIGPFSTLDSEACPVRLRHVRAAIDAHDNLVGCCLQRASGSRWAEAMEGFSDGIGLRITDAFKEDGWYKTLTQLSRTWEREYQPHIAAPMSAVGEMRSALKRRALPGTPPSTRRCAMLG